MGEYTKENETYKRGHEIGKKPERGLFKMTACPDCGVGRWVVFYSGKPKYTLCRQCSFKIRQVHRIGSGKGFQDKDGYRAVRVSPDDPYRSMGVRWKGTHVLEHRLVMARHLGRCLESHEIVHHLNGVKDDNRIENLLLVTRETHAHANDPYKARIRELEDRLSLYERAANGHVMCA